uniref:Uncharacterized protein n=1 Tax=Cannabis sativa TaxID=3483 RepID=A0A803PQJ2_CANSA
MSIGVEAGLVPMTRCHLAAVRRAHLAQASSSSLGSRHVSSARGHLYWAPHLTKHQLGALSPLTPPRPVACTALLPYGPCCVRPLLATVV